MTKSLALTNVIKIDGSINYLMQFVKNEKILVLNVTRKNKDLIIIYDIEKIKIINTIEPMSGKIYSSLFYTTLGSKEDVKVLSLD